MIHDELLATINANLCNREGCDGEHYKKDNLHGEWFALRAVVELHKPRTIKGSGWSREVCRGCDRDTYEGFCPTIQAIEKELING